jgi:hypothetical protein
MARSSSGRQMIHCPRGCGCIAVQSENAPYKYVTVEGPVVANEAPPTRGQALAIVRRYLPEEEAAGYVGGALGKHTVLVRVRPERWLSSDHGKQDQS